MAITPTGLCLSHDLIINLLLNHLTMKGCNVYVEVTIPTSSSPIQRLAVGENGSLTPTFSRRLRGRVDVVAVCGDTVIGYEVKCSVNDVSKTLSDRQGQLLSYVDSGFFDEFYLVVPKRSYEENVCSDVLASYGSYLKSIGVGLVCIDASGEINVQLKPGDVRASADIRPYLTQSTEGFLKQLLINYLKKKGYRVFTEVYVPKPLLNLTGLYTHSTKCYTPTAWLNRVDLIATDCSNGVCSYVSCSEGECSDIIGIEVKFGRKASTQQISNYLGSHVLTEVWLAVSNTGYSASYHAGLTVSEGEFRLIRNTVKAKPDVCALVFVSGDFTSLSVYSFCDFCYQKRVISLGSYYSEFTYSSLQQQKEVLKNILKEYGILPDHCRKCKVIFIRRSRRGSSCYPTIVEF